MRAAFQRIAITRSSTGHDFVIVLGGFLLSRRLTPDSCGIAGLWRLRFTGVQEIKSSGDQKIRRSEDQKIRKIVDEFSGTTTLFFAKQGQASWSPDLLCSHWR
jgi:hypothetical protein